MSEENINSEGDEKGGNLDNSTLLESISKMIDDKLSSSKNTASNDEDKKDFKKSDSKKEEELKIKEQAREEIKQEEWFNSLKSNVTNELYTINPDDLLNIEKKYSDNLETKVALSKYLINESFFSVEGNKNYLLEEEQESLFDEYNSLTDKQKQERAGDFYELYITGKKLFEKEKRAKATIFVNGDSFSKNNKDPFPDFGKRKFDYLEGDK